MGDTIETAQQFIYVQVFFNTPPPPPSHSFSSTQVYFCCESGERQFLNETIDPL